MSITIPCSTALSNESCWDLLNRWISSMNRMGLGLLKKKGHTCELMDSEELDGAEVFVLKLTKEDGDIEYYYMDAENFVVLKVVSKTIANGSEIEVEALMSNFQDFGGYIMPLTTEQKFNGETGMTMNIEDVARDEKVDNSIFLKPATPANPAE